jgi:hypothetical protein
MKVIKNHEINEQVRSLKNTGALEICTINIVKEEEDSFDICIWDEIENERREDLEEGYFESYDEADKRLLEIVLENEEITFLRMEDRL